MHVGTGLGVAIGRRDGFGAMTGREAISAQDICFLGVAIGVAGGVKGSELSEVDSWGVVGGVSIIAGSLDGARVAGVVGIVATAFGVEGGVGIGADTAIGVVSAGSLVEISAGSAFDEEGGVGMAVSLGVVFAISLDVTGLGGAVTADSFAAGFSAFFWW